MLIVPKDNTKGTNCYLVIIFEKTTTTKHKQELKVENECNIAVEEFQFIQFHLHVSLFLMNFAKIIHLKYHANHLLGLLFIKISTRILLNILTTSMPEELFKVLFCHTDKYQACNISFAIIYDSYKT
jgi:hypothetical protein